MACLAAFNDGAQMGIACFQQLLSPVYRKLLPAMFDNEAVIARLEGVRSLM